MSCKNQNILNVYTLMGLGISVYLWHHHHQVHKHMYHLPKFAIALFIIITIIILGGKSNLMVVPIVAQQ